MCHNGMITHPLCFYSGLRFSSCPGPSLRDWRCHSKNKATDCPCSWPVCLIYSNVSKTSSLVLSAGFPFKWSLFLGLDDDGHADVSEVFFERDDILVEQADAAFAGATGNTLLVIGAAMNTNAAVAGCFQTQEPMSVGLDVAASVLEVVAPG